MADRVGQAGPLNRRDLLRLLGLTGLAAAPLGRHVSMHAAGLEPSQSTHAIPSGAIIRTVLNDVSPDALAGQATLIHEHLDPAAYSSPPRPMPPPTANPAGSAPRLPGPREATPEGIDLVVDELQQSRRDGLGAIVDTGLYRRSAAQIATLQTIARRAGIHVIAAGAYYRAPYPGDVIAGSEDEIADELASDAQAQRWGAFGEIGSSLETQSDERKMMRAFAKAHLRTGLPIFTHTPHESCPSCAMEQLDIYTTAGVDPRHLCIGHLSDLKDDPRAETPKAIAKRGAFVGFDTVGHELNIAKTTLVTDRMKAQMVVALIDAGLEDFVLLSSDMLHNNHLKANWGDGFSAVLVTFAPKLRHAGVPDSTIRKILHDNPRRFLAFVPKGA